MTVHDYSAKMIVTTVANIILVTIATLSIFGRLI